MSEEKKIEAAIVDYGLGNLFSVKHACEHVDMEAVITSSQDEILRADLVILPGVGAFGDAMLALKQLDLIQCLREIAASEKPLIGICLGMQLLMSESFEFGHHRGLGVIEGPVVKFKDPVGILGKLKVPQVGWNRIYGETGQPSLETPKNKSQNHWSDSPLQGLPEGEFMYFVHSYYAKPGNPEVILSISHYGDIEFCSSLRYRNIFASQFHPERSGPQGLQIYRNMARLCLGKNGSEEDSNG
jgi:glutamine amidotransferase